MGKFKCQCGNLLGGYPSHTGTSFDLVPEELEDCDPLGSLIDVSVGSLYRCSNCDRLHVEMKDGTSPKTFIRDDRLPQIWADFSVRDKLGRVLLVDPRSQAEIVAQHLIFNPPLEISIYDQSGRSARGEAHFGIADDGSLDKNLWAVDISSSE